ncbi:MAG: VOC family protein [Deltaproteobacteria bacterium]|nr:VOC family protein [Deltaproteobacteria bacterium]
MEYRLHHLHLICSDLDKMIHFFTNTLGGKFVSFRKFGTADGAVIDLAGAPIFLRAARDGEEITGDKASLTYGYHHIGLKVEDLDACYAELKGQHFTFTTPPTATPTGGKMAFFQGPDNIIIELVQEAKK